jgi:Protein of unknown function (DUF1549)/Protein of unknown function (DUF1553)/Planctomycete cytochrome C
MRIRPVTCHRRSDQRCGALVCHEFGLRPLFEGFWTQVRVHQFGRASHFVLTALVWIVAVISGRFAWGQPTDEQVEFFERRIRLILVAECYDCHGPQRQEGNLRLDSREALLRGGDSGPALIPSDVQNSLLMQVISHENDDMQMPMGREKLPPNVISDFETWIARGAADPRDQPADGSHAPADWRSVFAARSQWWSFQPVARVSLPIVAADHWPLQPIDRFILSKLEAHQLQPAQPASPTEWLRRVTFAIIGLPPAPEDVEAFLNDSSPFARQKVIERLLASPHFGERWARHWMDLVRFAESYGHEQDYEIPHAWRYRDYLIRAFNEDVPYDKFVKEHVAGDLLDEPRRHPSLGFNESIIATGFWYMHQATHAPVDPQQDEADRIDNQLDVFGKTFLGLTIACARCHDHKFDAISAHDYYALSAFLRGTRQDIAFLDNDRRSTIKMREVQQAHREITDLLLRATKRQMNQGVFRIKDYLMAAHETISCDPSIVTDSAQSSQLIKRVNDIAQKHSLNAEVLDRWIRVLVSSSIQQNAHPLHAWYILSLSEAGKEPVEEVVSPGSAQAADEPLVVAADVADWFPSGPAFRSLNSAKPGWCATEDRVELLPPTLAHSGRLADGLQGVLRSPTFKLTKPHLHLRVMGSGGKVRLVICRYTLRNFNPLLFNETLFDVNTNGEFEWRSLGADIHRYQGLSAYLELIDEGNGVIALDRVVLSDSEKAPDGLVAQLFRSTSLATLAAEIETNVQAQLHAWGSDEDQTDSLRLLHWTSRHGLLDWGDLEPEVMRQVARYKGCASDFPDPIRVLAMAKGTQEETRVFARGDYRNPGELVNCRLLEAIPTPMSADRQQVSDGRDLAERLVSTDNPLLCRVYVNRVWAHLFGKGLVATVDNFGAMGKMPTHPELLDYLSETFRSSGMSTKALVRTLCLSQAFAMSSAADDAIAEERDPDNELLHRQRITRLEGEIIRDSLLAVSGTLKSTLFGPSVPTHLSPYMGDPFWLTSRGIKSGPLDGDGRRSVYLETRRNFLSPWMLTFDGIIPDSTVGQRNTSNIPAQSLALMNDPFVKEQAEACARLILSDRSVPPEERIEQLFIRAVARSVEADELRELMDFIRSQSELRMLTPDEAAVDEQIWADVCHIVFMLKEFIFVR